jgi:tetratricopeptide (TPR) repeat protein
MRKYICIGIIFWSLQFGFAQLKNAVVEYDSLMKILPTLMNDTDRIDMLYKIGSAIFTRDPYKGIALEQEAIALCEKINDQKRLVQGMLKLGYIYAGNGETSKCISILQKVVRMTEKNDKTTAAIATVFMAIAYQNQGDLLNALKYTLSAYNALEERRKKRDYSDEMVGTPMRIGEIYFWIGKIDSAYYYLQESHTIMGAYNMTNRYFSFHVPLLLAKIHLKRQENTLAYSFIQEGFKKAHSLNDVVGIAEADLELANYYKQINQPDSTIIYAISALNSAKKN